MGPCFVNGSSNRMTNGFIRIPSQGLPLALRVQVPKHMYVYIYIYIYISQAMRTIPDTETIGAPCQGTIYHLLLWSIARLQDGAPAGISDQLSSHSPLEPRGGEPRHPNEAY